MAGYKQLNVLWFILGLGSKLQIVASLSITELICLIMAPIIFMQDQVKIRRYGIMPFFSLSCLVAVGCLVASLLNYTPGYFFIRGLAVACLLPCSILMAVRMFDRSMNGFKWYFLGAAISAVLSIFVFQAEVEKSQLAAGAEGMAAVADIVKGPLFWLSRLGPFIAAPIQGWYLHTPFAYSLLAPLFLTVLAMAMSASGRAVALTSLMAFAFVLIGQKTRQRMRLISRYFIVLIALGVVGVFVLKGFYAMAASKGWLGEDSRRKYEVQTRGKSGMMDLLIGGRIASFVGYAACLDNPIIGYGPFPEDKKDYVGQFLEKYGSEQDYVDYIVGLQREMRLGFKLVRTIPAHSCVVSFWLQFGIFGLLFWVYVLFVLFRYLKQDITAVPQFYGWMACSIPSILWAMFFSPFSARFSTPLFVVACLIARAVRMGKIRMPLEMIREIDKAERK